MFDLLVPYISLMLRLVLFESVQPLVVKMSFHIPTILQSTFMANFSLVLPDCYLNTKN